MRGRRWPAAAFCVAGAAHRPPGGAAARVAVAGPRLHGLMVIAYGDVEQIHKNDIQDLYNWFPRVSHVHLLGGFPCVHLSSARHGLTDKIWKVRAQNFSGT